MVSFVAFNRLPSFNILFESETGCSSHDAVQRFFEAAEALAGLRKRWTSSGLCDSLLDLTQSFGGRHDAQPDAVLVMAAQSNEGLGPDQVTAIGLSKASVLRINSNESLGRFTVVAPFRMSFDRERRRWLISIDGGKDLELGISSQMIEMPLAHGAGDVRVLFARPER